MTSNPDILAFARQHGVDPITVEAMAQHVMDTMGAAMLEEQNEAAQIELMRAGVESSVRTTRAMATKALTKQGEFGKAVYDILKEREP